MNKKWLQIALFASLSTPFLGGNLMAMTDPEQLAWEAEMRHRMEFPEYNNCINKCAEAVDICDRKSRNNDDTKECTVIYLSCEENCQKTY